MSVDKVAIADMRQWRQLISRRRSLGRQFGRGWWVNQDRRSGEPQQLGEQQIASRAPRLFHFSPDSDFLTGRGFRRV
jgi:hypothetical protein